MLNGLYSSTSGLLMQQQRLDTISNNLANVNTAAYKKDTSVFTLYRPEFDQRYPQNYIKESLYNETINSVVQLDDVVTNFERGHFKQTSNTFDVALENPNAFIAIETPWGVRYTRSGEFTLNNEGELVTQDGFNVMSANNPGTENIVIPQGQDIQMTIDGAIHADNVAVDAIMIVEFDEVANLQKVGRNQYTAVGTEGVQTANGGVRQGFIEASNVNAIGEMVKMIDASRGYEMYSKVVQTHDDTMQQSNSRIAGQS